MRLGEESIGCSLKKGQNGRKTTASASGTVTSLSVYVDASSNATKLVIGIYSDKSGTPGKLLAQGTLAASIAQFPSEMGRLAIETAVKLIRGEKVPADQRTKIGLVTREATPPAPGNASR